MSFDSVADGLYALAPDRFVAERNAAEKQARAAGERELAARIHALAKPTVVGWLANQLVRSHPEEIGPLLELGAGLREATAALRREKLQELMRLQHQVIAGLIKQARAVARGAGQRVSEDAVRGLEDTLRAALAEESLGEQLLAGRLTGPLEHVGFTGSTATTDVSAPGSTQRSKPEARKPVKRAGPDPRIALADQTVTEARAEMHERNGMSRQAKERTEKASRALQVANEKLQQLQDQLDEATSKQASAADNESEARKAWESSEKAGERARRRLEDALAKRAELS